MRQYFGLEPEERLKTLFLLAGVRGGTGKTTLACNLLDWLRYRRSPGVGVRAFDLDPNVGLSRFYPDVEHSEFPTEVLGQILADCEHSYFLIDPPPASQDLMRSVFAGFSAGDLFFEGLHVVLVAPVTGDRSSLENLSGWLDFVEGEVLLVYNRFLPPVKAVEVEAWELPLWLEAAGPERVKRVIQPEFKPSFLVQHLFNKGISLYQAAYPYSAWALREVVLGEEKRELFELRRRMNREVGRYGGAGREYHGVGLYYGYQFSVWLGFLYRQLADLGF